MWVSWALPVPHRLRCRRIVTSFGSASAGLGAAMAPVIRLGAGGEARADTVLRHHDHAVLGEVLIAAGVIAVKWVLMRYDRERRDRRDRGLDLGGERRNWPSTMMMPSECPRRR